MTHMDLNKIGFFNPRRLTDKEVELSFVARQSLFEHLFHKIVDNEPNNIPQHLLIIGQRGMGKTSLLMRIAVELKKPNFNELFIPLTYPEEQYNVDRLSKFWLNSLDALADALDRENKSDLTKELDKAIAQKSSKENLEQSEVYELFESWANKIGRRPVLLLDNLNLIFDKISQDEQHSLRAILMQEGAPIVVGASATTIQQTVDYGEPFYDAFQTSYLKKLDLSESIEVLMNLGRITRGDNSLDAEFNKHRGRIAALHHLTGGTPRTLAMLFSLIKGGFGKEVQHDLEALLDIITPLYKARFEELSPQMQIILDAIALNWDPIDLEGIRNTTKLTNAQLSPQLKRLSEVGWITKIKSKKSKGGVYEISERFFNVWYLMRRSSRRQLRELYCLTKFLEAFYGSEVDEIARQRLKLGHTDINQISWDLAFAEAATDKDLKEQLISESNRKLIDLAKENDEILKNFSLRDREIAQEIIKLIELSKAHYENQNWSEVIKLSRQGLRLQPTQKRFLLPLGSALVSTENYQEALNVLNELVKWESCESEIKAASLLLIGRSYLEGLNDTERAKLAFYNALEIDPNNNLAIESLINIIGPDNTSETIRLSNKLKRQQPENIRNILRLGMLYTFEGDYSSAIHDFNHVLKVDQSSLWAYLGLAMCYLSTEQMDKAQDTILRGIKIFPKEGTFYYFLGKAAEFSSSTKTSEIQNLYETALDLGQIKVEHQNSIGSFYLNRTREFGKAKQLFINSIKLNNETSLLAHYNLIFLLRDKLGEIENALNELNTINEVNRIPDLHNLNQALFEYYNNNFGNAEEHIQLALKNLNDKWFPTKTRDDWWRAAATIVKLGHGQHLLSVLKETGNDIVLRPYYEAIRAMLEKDSESHFNEIAAELREPTREILEFMQRYNAY